MAKGLDGQRLPPPAGYEELIDQYPELDVLDDAGFDAVIEVMRTAAYEARIFGVDDASDYIAGVEARLEAMIVELGRVQEHNRSLRRMVNRLPPLEFGKRPQPEQDRPRRRRIWERPDNPRWELGPVQLAYEDKTDVRWMPHDYFAWHRRRKRYYETFGRDRLEREGIMNLCSFRLSRTNAFAFGSKFFQAIVGTPNPFYLAPCKPTAPEDLAAILFPAGVGPQKTANRQWYLPSSPMEMAGMTGAAEWWKNGLFRIVLLDGGWGFGWLTARGYELAVEGETTFFGEEPLEPGYLQRWGGFMSAEPHPAVSAALALGQDWLVPGILAALETYVSPPPSEGYDPDMRKLLCQY